MRSIFLSEQFKCSLLKSPPNNDLKVIIKKKYNAVVWKKNAIVFYKYMYTGMYILHLYLFVAFLINANVDGVYKL